MDRIYYNGNIITMAYSSAEEETSHSAEAVWVSDGIIKAVSAADEIRKTAPADAEWIDLGGSCLMPGFIDPHSHFVMNGRMAAWCDLSDCSSHQEIIDKMIAYNEKAGEIPAVIGYGYDHNFLAEGTHPDRRVLDQISTSVPVVALHVSLHFACCNSLVLAALGITADTPDPEGGRFGRIEGSSEPSGYLEESAMNLMMSAFSQQDAGGFDPALTQRTYLQYGVTTAQDGDTTPAEMAALDAMARAGALVMDIVAYPDMPDSGRQTAKTYSRYLDGYADHLKIGGYKLILDGSPQGRSAWMSQPYLGGDPDYCAYPWMSDSSVEGYIAEALSEGRQIMAHCNGDAASEQFLNAYTSAFSRVRPVEDIRPVMIHCQTVRNDQLDRMKDLNMIASIFIGHVWYWGDIHMMNFGTERGSRISPARDALDRGLHVNFHQDTPVTRPDVMHSVWCAVNRISRRGNVIGADQKISVYEALRAVTVEGAYQYHEEASKGTIEPGKRADLVILDRDPLSIPAMELKDIKVLKTIKDGTTVYTA